MLYNITTFILSIIFKILFRFQAFGKNNFPKKGGFILASNHLSYLDPIALSIASPRKLSFLAKEELFDVKGLGLFLSAVGNIPVKRDSSQGIATFRKALSLLEREQGLAVFPEGARSLSGKLQEMQAGVGFLALKSQCPVIPALIVGTEKALPVGAKFVRPRKIKVYIGKALFPPKEFREHEDFENFSREVKKSIKELQERVRNASKLKDVTKSNKDF